MRGPCRVFCVCLERVFFFQFFFSCSFFVEKKRTAVRFFFLLCCRIFSVRCRAVFVFQNRTVRDAARCWFWFQIFIRCGAMRFEIVSYGVMRLR